MWGGGGLSGLVVYVCVHLIRLIYLWSYGRVSVCILYARTVNAYCFSYLATSLRLFMM